MSTQEILQQCTVEGMTIKLPNIQLDRNAYLEVKKKLELIGGAWKGGKVQGFVFNENPTDLLEQIANGEARNLKKEYQFFATPDEIADLLVSYADLKVYQTILEPSAGQGAIIHAIQRKIDTNVYWFELMPLNQTFLNKITGAMSLGDDFLNCDTQFDRIIANPPFSKNQDIDHVKHMYNCLKVGGRLVSVMSKSWTLGSQKKQVEFREWLDEANATVHEIERGAFKDSGTMVGSVIAVIDKL